METWNTCSCIERVRYNTGPAERWLLDLLLFDDILKSPTVIPRGEDWELVFSLGNGLVAVIKVLISSLPFFGEAIVQLVPGPSRHRSHVRQQVGTCRRTFGQLEQVVIWLDFAFVETFGLDIAELEQLFAGFRGSRLDFLPEHFQLFGALLIFRFQHEPPQPGISLLVVGLLQEFLNLRVGRIAPRHDARSCKSRKQTFKGLALIRRKDLQSCYSAPGEKLAGERPPLLALAT